MSADIDQLGKELSDVETTISAWCMRMAWPGGTPTPPFDAWQRRSEIYAELRTLGVTNPRYEHLRWRERQTTVSDGLPTIE